MAINEKIKNSQNRWITLRQIEDNPDDTIIYGKLATDESVFANNIGENTLYNIVASNPPTSYNLQLYTLKLNKTGA